MVQVMQQKGMQGAGVSVSGDSLTHHSDEGACYM